MKQTVLLYNLKGTKKGREIAMIFSYLGFRVRQVDKADYGLPIADLMAGETTADKEETGDADAGSTADFSDEMLVLDVARDDTLNKALYMMKKEHVMVDLKAVVTDNNRNWNSDQLHTEISKEHEAMKGNK